MTIRPRRLLIVGALVGPALLVFGCSLNLPREAMARATKQSLSLDGRAKLPSGIHFLTTGKSKATATVFFVHGTPGDLNNWGLFTADPDLQRQARLVAIDRLGFGKSWPDRPEPDLSKQAIACAEVAVRFPGRRIWVGHSYGGPVIAQVAQDYPELVDGLILVASPADPSVSQPRWYHRLADTGLGKAVISDQLHFANEEMLTLSHQLEALRPLWSDFRKPISLVHAQNDVLADWQNALFVKKERGPAPLRFLDMEQRNHFLIWNSVPEILTEIRWHLQQKP